MENQELTGVKKELTREEKLFKHTPIWKSLIIMAIPSMILMLVFGSYFFFDSVLSINLASDSYQNGIALNASDKVRLFMNGYSPINSLMIAFSLLFAMGISTRVAINLGANRQERALRTIKTGNMIALFLSLMMIFILLISAKPWIASQYDSSISQLVANESFKYAWPIIVFFPITMFNQIISSLLRVEARNRQMLIALVCPIFINLFGDWLFMGPIGMGVAGGAWATVISNFITTLLLLFFIIKTPKSIILLKNLFGFKFKIIPIVGIILVGISPFLRNIAQSITSTTQMNIVKDISSVIYKGKFNHLHLSFSATKNLEANFMTVVITGAIPIFTLFFPVMFSFAQAARPIAAYNYGAKNYKRVKATYWWTTIYAFIAAIIIYFTVAFGISGPLMDILKVSGQAYETSKTVLRILMLALIGFSLAISGMVVLGSTDRVLLSIIASAMQGLILFFPIMFFMKFMAINNASYQYLFWWSWPIINTTSSIIITILTSFTMIRLNKKKQMTLDERINKIDNWITKKIKHDIKK